jgi:WD40 repeat protein
MFSPDGQRILTVTDTEKVQLWRASEAKMLAELEGRAASFSPDGSLLATSCHGNAACVWDVAHGQLRSTLVGHTSPIQHVQFLAGDGHYLVTCSFDQIRIWNIVTGELSASVLNVREPYAISADGTHIASVDNQGTASIYRRFTLEDITILVPD